MGRSPPLRVYCQQLYALFGLAFAAPPTHKVLGLPLTITRRLIKQKARHHPLRGSDTLQAHDFRIYFTPLTAVLFTFPSRYLFTIGRQLVFSLTPWSAWIHTKLHLDRVTQGLPRRTRIFDYRPLTFYGAIFHSLHLIVVLPHRGPINPTSKLMVWAVPLSLATTYGIAFAFFSSGY
jgi:hypothetical protein